MAHEYLTLQEASDALGKSAQTIRRMIKKGDLKAERIRTPQGFQYAIVKTGLPFVSTAESPLTSRPLTGYEQPVTSQKISSFSHPTLSPAPIPSEAPAEQDSGAFLENDFYIVEPTHVAPPLPHSSESTLQKEREEHSRRIHELVHLHHKEKMLLITILERLQAELAIERQRRYQLENRTLMGGLKAFFKRVLRRIGALFLRWGEPA